MLQGVLSERGHYPALSSRTHFVDFRRVSAVHERPVMLARPPSRDVDVHRRPVSSPATCRACDAIRYSTRQQ